MMEKSLLAVALAAAFYHAGVDVVIDRETYKSWQLLSHPDFRRVRSHYERNLFVFFFLPGIVQIVCLVSLILTAGMEINYLHFVSLTLIFLNYFLSALLWAKWQKQVSSEDLPPDHPLVNKIIRTNWIRTFIVILNGAVLLCIVIVS